MVAASVPVGCAVGFALAGRAAMAWATPRSHGPAVAVLIAASALLSAARPRTAPYEASTACSTILSFHASVSV